MTQNITASFDAIPAALKAYPQWIVWKAIWNEERKKYDKIPFSAHTGFKCSIVDPANFCSFNRAVETLKGNASFYSGIGFCITRSDPFTFVDLDDAQGNEALINNQIAIYNGLNSYSELSPSGKGLHIICVGSVEARRTDGVEIYSHDRFMTMTGNRYGDALEPVECQDKLNELVAHIDAVRQRSVRDFIPSISGDAPPTRSDNEIYAVACQASNGAKFEALWRGDLSSCYNDHSRADYALIDMLAYYTENFEQVKRLFLLSALGQRDKAKNRIDDYVMPMIRRAYDRHISVAGIDDAAMLAAVAGNNVAPVECASQGVEKAAALDGGTSKRDADSSRPHAGGDEIAWPPGRMGELASFMWDQTRYPNHKTAVTAALTYMAAECGAAYEIDGKGPALYFLVLGGTGIGKSAMAQGIRSVVAQIRTGSGDLSVAQNAGDFLSRSAAFASGPAFVKHAFDGDFQSTLCIDEEGGANFSRLLSPKASEAAATLKSVYTDIWENNGPSGVLRATAHSDTKNSAPLREGCAFSWLTESVEEEVISLINEDQVKNGFLSRFIVVNLKHYSTVTNIESQYARLSPELRKLLTALSVQAGHSRLSKCSTSVQMEDGVRKSIFDESGANRIRANEELRARGSVSNRTQLAFRDHARIARVAALLAIADNHIAPVITMTHYMWARQFVEISREVICSWFEQGEIGASDDHARYDAIVNFLQRYTNRAYADLPSKDKVSKEDHSNRIISRSYLNISAGRSAVFKNAPRGSNDAFNSTINQLSANGILNPCIGGSSPQSDSRSGQRYLIGRL